MILKGFGFSGLKDSSNVKRDFHGFDGFVEEWSFDSNDPSVIIRLYRVPKIFNQFSECVGRTSRSSPLLPPPLYTVLSFLHLSHTLYPFLPSNIFTPLLSVHHSWPPSTRVRTSSSPTPRCCSPAR